MSLTPATAQTLRHALATAVVVPVTPLHADGSPDWDTYAALTGRLIDGGITVITPNGNTGEFYALSQAEARQAVETAAMVSRGRAELLAGVGHDIATAVEAARHAQDHGARMIMIHQPVHPYVSGGRLDRLPRRHRRRRPRPGRRPVHQGRAPHRRAHRRARRAVAERGRRQVRRPRRDQVRRRGAGTPGSTGSPGWRARPS